MKIGFLLQDIGVIYGAQRATLDLLRMLAAAGVEAHVALMRETRRTDLPADFRTALAGDSKEFWFEWRQIDDKETSTWVANAATGASRPLSGLSSGS